MPDRHPAAVGRAGEVGAEHHELFGAGEADAVAGPHELRIREDHLGRHHAGAQQPTFAVEILEHEIEQFGPLDHAAFDHRPLAARHDERDRVEGPSTALAGLLRGVVVRHPVLFEQRPDLVAPPCQFRHTERSIRGGEAGPVIPDVAVGVHHLVVAVGERPIAGDRVDDRQRRHRITNSRSFRRRMAAEVERAGVLARDRRREAVEFGDVDVAGVCPCLKNRL